MKYLYKILNVFLCCLLTWICVFLILKSALQFSMAYDFMMYHLPFALQKWHLTTYSPFERIVNIHGQLPDFANHLQGLLIVATRRFSSANLVNIIGLALSIVSAKMIFRKEFALQWFLVVFLAIPLCVIHSTIGYIDLFAGEMVLTAFIGMYGIFQKRSVSSHIVFTIGLLASVLTRMQTWPICMLFACAVVMRTLYIGQSYKSIIYCALITCIISFYPIRNILHFQNPTYPIQMPFIGKLLNLPSLSPGGYDTNVPPFLLQKSRPVQFFSSVFEINRFVTNEKYVWTYDQYDPTPKSEHLRMGGWFFLSVLGIVASVIYAFYCRKINRICTMVFALSVVLTSLIPHALELRYSLYIPLISAFLLALYVQNNPSHFVNLLKIHFTLCAAIVLVNMPPGFWSIDMRHPSELAPPQAKEFWKMQNGNMDEIEIHQPSHLGIFWAGPTFSEFKVKNVKLQ